MLYIEPPLFTVILHTFFRPGLLKESVKAMLNQTYGNHEIILIDEAILDTINLLINTNVKDI